MAFTRKGEKRGHRAGRTRGTPNRITADLRDSILKAAAESGGDPKGLVKYLKTCATSDDPRVKAAFLGLLGRCLPREIKLDDLPLLVIRDYTGRSPQVERSE